MEKTKKEEKALASELKNAIHKMLDDISDESILVKAYTFIKYLK